MECHYAINGSATHPEQVMFRSFKEAAEYDFRNPMQHGGKAMSVPEDLSRPGSKSLLFDMVQAGLQANSQKLAALNYVSCYSEFATSSKSYATSQDSRSPEEPDELIFRPPVDEFEDNLGYSRSPSLGTLLPLLDRDVRTPLGRASKVADDQGLDLHFQREGEEAARTDLVMEKILRDHFPDSSQSSYNLRKVPENSSIRIPTPTLSNVQELEFRPFFERIPTSSAQFEFGMSPEYSPTGLPARLFEPMATSEFMPVPSSFRRPDEVPHGGHLKSNYRKWKQQRPSDGARRPSPSFRATSNRQAFKSKARSRMEADAVELPASSRQKRRRNRITSGDPSGETQRRIHIEVERNRRRQMNEYIAALKSLMPPAFIQKTDQASIVGGAVEFVKELEVLVESLESMRRRRTYAGVLGPDLTRFNVSPWPVLRIAPPYSTPSTFPASSIGQGFNTNIFSRGIATLCPGNEQTRMSSELQLATIRPEIVSVRPAEVRAECTSLVARVDVEVLENFAKINIASHWRAKESLAEVVVGIESLGLSVVHVEINTSKSTALYTFDAKMGGQCRMTVHQIAASVHQTFKGLSYPFHG